MKSLTQNLLLLLVLSSFTFTACKKDKDDDDKQPDPTPAASSMRLELEHTFGPANFALNTPYVSSGGDTLNFNLFRYYISNLVLVKTDGSEYAVPESYYLVDQSVPTSRLITISNVPVADYKGFRFMLGVDSTRNVSGNQVGALDPANNMFWSWNTGYIFVKAEGTSPQSTGMGGSFSYHLGGFRTANNTRAYQTFSHTFTGEVMSVKPNAIPQIHMKVDVRSIFNGVSVASNPMTHMPGANAMSMMQNFASGVEYEHLHN